MSLLGQLLHNLLLLHHPEVLLAHFTVIVVSRVLTPNCTLPPLNQNGLNLGRRRLLILDLLLLLFELVCVYHLLKTEPRSYRYRRTLDHY